MKTRIAAILSILVGPVAVALGGWGLATTDAMVSAPTEREFDSRLWSLHWRGASLLVVGLGLALLTAGIVLLYRKRWGFALVAISALIAALLPWLMLGMGLIRYEFEKPGVLETAIFASVAIAAYLASRPKRAHAET